MSTKQTHTAQQNFLFLALLQVKYAKQKQANEELLNILLLVVHATRLCQNENCFSGMDASDENCCEFANANSIAQTAGTPFERYELNYNLDYEYDANFVHRAKRIGKQHYLYDLNGNLISEQEGAYSENEPDAPHEVIQTGNLYSVDYGWGMVNPDATPTSTPNITRRNYTWNERNLLKTSTDRSYSVQYKYGADGQRSAKYSVGSNGVSETLYFNKMYNWRYDSRIMPRDGRVSKHIYLGETRILTKLESAGNDLSAIVSEELTKQYYYHTDHLGSAQLISDHDGKEYERIEYTPYGELWIEKKTTISQIDIPFRFTGKERDEETGLYYYGARYLDAKTSRWLSTDPALGEYIPQAPINDEAKKANGKLPGGGGVFNVVNSHLYNYANNNPIKYTDPDGYAPFSMDFLWQILAGSNDSNTKLFGLVASAMSGNQSSQDRLGYVAFQVHQVGRTGLEKINTTSSVATLVFLTVGLPEVAAVSGTISAITSGALAFDDILTGNLGEGIVGFAVMGIGGMAGNAVKNGVNQAIKNQLNITVGKNGQFYSMGRRGALSKWDTIKRQIKGDIASGVFGRVAPEAVSQIIGAAKEAYKALSNHINEQQE